MIWRHKVVFTYKHWMKDLKIIMFKITPPSRPILAIKDALNSAQVCIPQMLNKLIMTCPASTTKLWSTASVRRGLASKLLICSMLENASISTGGAKLALFLGCYSCQHGAS